MENNDILRRIRYALDLKDEVTIEIFKFGNVNLDIDKVRNLLKKDNAVGYEKCSNQLVLDFLEGLIVYKRGTKEGAIKDNEIIITNNLIFKKLKIAFNLKSEDVLDILKIVNVEISKSELSAIFRKPGHRNYKECGDRYLRNFLKGLAIYYREN